MAINFKRLEEITRALKPTKQTGKCFHTTFAFKGNKMLAIGYNNYNKLHPHHKFGVYEPTKDLNSNYTAGIHSEISCLIKLGVEDCSDITFVNVRIDNNDKPAISKPCANCECILEQVGNRKVWFFDGDFYVYKGK
jgi:hypothetical protein